MPHFVASTLQRVPMPVEKEGLRFVYQAEGLYDSLVLVEGPSEQFFLKISKKPKGYLVKADKATKPSQPALLQKALRTYAALSEAALVHDNVHPKTEKKERHFAQHKPPLFFVDHTVLQGKRVWVEIGFGSGRHILHQAKAHPDVMHIGLEVHKPSALQLLKRSEAEGCANIWVVEYDARIFLELLASNSVERIFVHFPVPWEKSPGRRVVSDAFIEEAMRVLVPTGTLEIRTDSEEYSAYVGQLLDSRSGLVWHTQQDTPLAVESKYEARWTRQGKTIYDITVQATEESDAREAAYDFSWRGIAPAHLHVSGLDAAMLRGPTHIAHIERLYRVDAARVLVKLVMGAYTSCEKKYLLCTHDGISYLPFPPLPTRPNFEAHCHIREWITQGAQPRG